MRGAFVGREPTRAPQAPRLTRAGRLCRPGADKSAPVGAAPERLRGDPGIGILSPPTASDGGMTVEKVELIWMNGDFVPGDEANVHVLTHGLHYGTGVFEGIRCYDGERGPAIFRHTDHLRRLANSADLYHLELPRSTEEIREATKELIRRNG